MTRAEFGEAAVQLSDGGGVLRGTFDMVPWGFGDTSYRITLETGQTLHVWLDGVTTAEQPEQDDERCDMCGSDGGDDGLADADGFGCREDGQEISQLCLKCACAAILAGPLPEHATEDAA